MNQNRCRKSSREDKRTEEEKNKYLCSQVEKAIAVFHADEKDDNGFNVVQELFKGLQNNIKFYVPFDAEDSFLEMLFKNGIPKEGDTFQNDKEMHFHFKTLDFPGGGYVVPLFTSIEEVNKGETVSTFFITLDEMLVQVSQFEHCRGLVINPWGKAFYLSINLIRNLLKLRKVEKN